MTITSRPGRSSSGSWRRSSSIVGSCSACVAAIPNGTGAGLDLLEERQCSQAQVIKLSRFPAASVDGVLRAVEGAERPRRAQRSIARQAEMASRANMARLRA